MDAGNGVVDKAAIRACARQSFDKLELQLNAAIEKQCQELSGKMEVNHCIKYSEVKIFNGKHPPVLLRDLIRRVDQCVLYACWDSIFFKNIG